MSPSCPLPQYGFGQDLQWYATDAIAGRKFTLDVTHPLGQGAFPVCRLSGYGGFGFTDDKDDAFGHDQT